MARNILLYGPSGTCKTSLLGTFLTGMHRANGKRARMYNVDGGVDTIRYQVDNGTLDIAEMLHRAFPFECLVDASQGAWPEDISDPTSNMIPAFLIRYIAECAPCKKRLYDQDKPCVSTHVMCDGCKAQIAVRPRRAFNPKNDLSKVGAILYEGVTGFSERLLDNQAERSARGDKIGGDIAVRFKDGNVDVGSNTQSSYSVAQRRVKSAIEASRLLPVDYVIWTAHKDRGTDDMKRVPVYGPKLAGHAATDDAPRWFGQCFSVCNWPVSKGVEKRIYLSNYFEDFSTLTKDVEHICNSRVPPHVLKDLPTFFVFDKDKKGEFGGETLLWDIVKLIERKQGEASKGVLAGVK